MTQHHSPIVTFSVPCSSCQDRKDVVEVLLVKEYEDIREELLIKANFNIIFSNPTERHHKLVDDKPPDILFELTTHLVLVSFGRDPAVAKDEH
ncbi:unnamed protein product [Larinioides sclopetarius]|uniref:Uncharacterized protein n=1 Tax=Larinioides sclopetarius TaxID=280406 RepID=A0AAV1YX37_9ARAC